MYIFDKSCKPITLKDTQISCLMYADDLVLLSETEQGLKDSLSKLLIYNEKWHLNINYKKSKTMIFQTRATKTLNITLNEQPIEEVKQFKSVSHDKYFLLLIKYFINSAISNICIQTIYILQRIVSFFTQIF